MVQLHVVAKVKDKRNLISNFKNTFFPAISKQKGFRACYLLFDTENKDYCELLISFDKELSREKWVQSKEHLNVWPKIKSCFEDILDKKFKVISGGTVLDIFEGGYLNE